MQNYSGLNEMKIIWNAHESCRYRWNLGRFPGRSIIRLSVYQLSLITDLWFAHLDGTVVLSLHALRVDLQVQLAHARRDRFLDHVVKMNLRGQRYVVICDGQICGK